jgi:hypothetical protein
MRHWVDDAAAVIADRLAGAAGGEPLLEAINTSVIGRHGRELIEQRATLGSTGASVSERASL